MGESGLQLIICQSYIAPTPPHLPSANFHLRLPKSHPPLPIISVTLNRIIHPTSSDDLQILAEVVAHPQVRPDSPVTAQTQPEAVSRAFHQVASQAEVPQILEEAPSVEGTAEILPPEVEAALAILPAWAATGCVEILLGVVAVVSSTLLVLSAALHGIPAVGLVEGYR